VSVGGYGEAVYRNFGNRREDGAASRAASRADQLRVVLYTGYKFDERILFNSEIEFEHATTGAGDEELGEVSVEFAYLDFRAFENAGFRAGMVLVPMGFVNELHEPPVFLSADRPRVERSLIPATWREVGAGVFGESGAIEWRGYVVASLDAAGFSSGGIRGGRQQGSESLAEDLGFTGRVDFTGVDGLLLGASLFTGETGQGRELDGRPVDGRLTLFDLHAQYQHRGVWLRALFAAARLGDAARINALNGLEGNASVGSRQRGFYVEGGYDLMSLAPHGRWSVTPFLRYERLDTQREVPGGFERNPARDETIWTAGVSVKPLPQVAIKADYQWFSNEAATGVNQFHLGVGYLF
jgi:hypothetical protein